MKSIFYRCLFFLVVLEGCGISKTQTDCPHYYDSVFKSQVYQEITTSPEFPGGKGELLRFIINRLSLTKEEYMKMDGKIVVQFLIDKEGKLLKPRIINKEEIKCTSIENRLLNILGEMPQWEPGKCNGKTVPTLIKMPLIID